MTATSEIEAFDKWRSGRLKLPMANWQLDTTPSSAKAAKTVARHHRIAKAMDELWRDRQQSSIPGNHDKPTQQKKNDQSGDESGRQSHEASTKNVAWLFKRHRKLVPLVHAVVRIQAEEQRLASQQNTRQQLADKRWHQIRKVVDSVSRKSEKSKATIVQRLKSTLDKLEGMRRGNASQAHSSRPPAPSRKKDKSPAMKKTLRRKRARQARSRAKKSEAMERAKM